MKKLLILLIIFVLMSPLSANAQDDKEQLTLLNLILFDKAVFKRVFFDYDVNNTYPGVSPSGKCAFILPDSVFRTMVLDIFDRIDRSWPVERMVATTSLIKNERGTVYSSAYLNNIEIEIWVLFDKFTAGKNGVNVTFHTTDYFGKSATKAFKYYRVECFIKKHNSRWRIKKMRVKKIGCCDDTRHFSKAARSPS